MFGISAAMEGPQQREQMPRMIAVGLEFISVEWWWLEAR
jgi:hypothetical protein